MLYDAQERWQELKEKHYKERKKKLYHMLLWRLWADLGCGNYSNACLFWSLIQPEILRHCDALNFPQIPKQ